VNLLKNNKKGAMFGLDARIALAIFGALSVISGAALYSAIRNVNVVQSIADLNEISKAIEQYMLDTYSDLPINSLPVSVRSSELVNNVANYSRWKGPYLPYEQGTSAAEPHLLHNIHEQIQIDKGRDMPFDAVVADGAECIAGEPCYYWIGTKNTEYSLCLDIDSYVDGIQDGENGNIRILPRAGNATCKIYFKGPLLLSQP
tara:strand:- start:5 stop:610 length:606 start_codon:yes stop_codon:yes gene_type:complete